MISTGYFSKTKDYLKAGLTPVSVARITPKFFLHKKWTIFAPPTFMLNKYKIGDITEEEFTEWYIEYLEKVVTDKMLNTVKKLFYEKDIVMCCYEAPNSFCHRHILADWLNKKLGLIITEVYITWRKK